MKRTKLGFRTFIAVIALSIPFVPSSCRGPLQEEFLKSLVVTSYLSESSYSISISVTAAKLFEDNQSSQITTSGTANGSIYFSPSVSKYLSCYSIFLKSITPSVSW